MILARVEPNSQNTSGTVYKDYEKTDFRTNGCVVGPVRGRNRPKLAKIIGSNVFRLSTVFKKYEINKYLRE